MYTKIESFLRKATEAQALADLTVKFAEEIQAKVTSDVRDNCTQTFIIESNDGPEDDVITEKRISEIVSVLARHDIRNTSTVLHIEIHEHNYRLEIILDDVSSYLWTRFFDERTYYRHRLTGPALSDQDGDTRYYLFGEEVPDFSCIKTETQACRYIQVGGPLLVIGALVHHKLFDASPEFMENLEYMGSAIRE